VLYIGSRFVLFTFCKRWILFYETQNFKVERQLNYGLHALSTFPHLNALCQVSRRPILWHQGRTRKQCPPLRGSNCDVHYKTTLCRPRQKHVHV